jgi:anti-sigma B factor antagonist
MEITTRASGSCQILDLNGKLVLGPATMKLRNAFHEAVEKNPGKIVLNMKNVPYVDTCGLGELINCYSDAKNFGCKLVLLKPNYKTMHLLILTKLETIFQIYQNEAWVFADSRLNRAVA